MPHGPEHFLSNDMDWPAAMQLQDIIAELDKRAQIVSSERFKEWSFACLTNAIKYVGSPAGFNLQPEQTTTLMNAVWSMMVQTAQQMKQHNAGHSDATPIFSIEPRQGVNRGNAFDIVVWFDPPDDVHAQLDQIQAARESR